MNNSPPMLDIRALSKSYDGRPALAGLDFHLQPGEVYGLLGPNGAGKTTTLKILAGLLTADGGEVRMGGERLHRDDRRLRQRIAYVPDQPFLYAKLTGDEHLNFFADLYEVPAQARRERADFLFAYFEFDEYRHELVEHYSAGTRQKLLIAQALLVEPQLLLLDEPLVSIDPLVGRKFKRLLLEVAARGTMVLFATHILSLAQEVCKRIGIIASGRIVAEGEVSELLARAGSAGGLEEFYFQTVMAHEKPLLA